jgi:hypothetical protein
MHLSLSLSLSLSLEKDNSVMSSNCWGFQMTFAAPQTSILEADSSQQGYYEWSNLQDAILLSYLAFTVTYSQCESMFCHS